MLPAERRLRKKDEFAEVFSSGLRYKTPHLLFITKNRASSYEPRVGVVISRKVSKKAVMRNRLRRVITHILRDVWEEVHKKHADVVVLVSSVPPEPARPVFDQEVKKWLDRR